MAALVRKLRQVAKRLRLTDAEVATLSSVSPTIVRACRRDGREPVRGPTRRSLAAFVDRAIVAHSRAELGLL